EEFSSNHRDAGRKTFYAFGDSWPDRGVAERVRIAETKAVRRCGAQISALYPRGLRSDVAWHNLVSLLRQPGKRVGFRQHEMDFLSALRRSRHRCVRLR